MLNLNRDEPQCFSSFKTTNNPHSYGDDCDDYELRECLRKALLKEQKKQCFYCEKKIDNNPSKVHIDHIKQRNSYHKLECEYSNMALSCNGIYNKKEAQYCGKYKDKQGVWDDKKFIRIISKNYELQENPSDFFIYRTNGEIGVKKSLSENEQERAINTIKYLNLNHKSLIEVRENIFLQLEMYKSYGYDIDEIFTFFNEFESLFKGD